MRTFLAILVAVLSFTALVSAQDRAPSGGERLVKSDDWSGFEFGTHRNGTSALVPAQGPGGFRQALRVEVRERGQMWDAEIGFPIRRAFRRGEVLLMRAWVREIRSFDESGQVLATFQVAMRRDPWSAPITRGIAVDGEWREFWIPGVVESDFGADDLFIKLSCGEARQTLEIGGVELWVYPVGTKVESLPVTRLTYEGRDPGAAWRAEADRRIRELRMAPIEVRFLDRRGKPVPNVDARVEMIRHAFEFGSAVSAREIAGPDTAATQRNRERFLSLFNSATFFNDLKWPAWLGEFGEYHNRPQAMDGLRWFKSQGIPFRGHVLVWPGYRNLPGFMKPGPQGALPGPVLSQLVLSHIDEILGATAGYIQEWDAINEPRDNHDIMDAAGRQVMVEWFKRAKQRAPDVRFALNDYSILPSRTDGPAIEAYWDNANYLIKNGAPLDVLGFQGHMGASYTAPTRLLQILDRFARLGKPIRITEFTMRVDDEELAHDYARDFLTVMFSHPSLIGVQTWGMGNMFRDDGTLRGAGRAWMKRIREDWWTRLSASTDSDGAVRGRGFLGRYRVTVGSEVFEFDLRKGQAPVVFTLNR